MPKRKPSRPKAKKTAAAASTTAATTTEQHQHGMVPTSDVLYHHKDPGTGRIQQSFYQGIQIPIVFADNQIQQHTVVLGDLCAVESAAGFSGPPFEQAHWKVAQILALALDLTQQPVAKHVAIVRWMTHFKQEGSLVLDKASLKRLRDTYRGDQLLLETDQLQQVDLSAILPAEIVIQSNHVFTTKDVVPPVRLVGNCWKVYFQCPTRVDSSGAQTRVQTDWLQYQAAAQATPPSSVTATTAPKVLLRGWEDLAKRAQPLAVLPGWTDQDFSKLRQALIQGCGQGERAERFQLLGGDTVDDNDIDIDDASGVPDGKENATRPTRKNVRSTGRTKKPAPTKKKRQKADASAPTTRPKRAASVERKTTQRKSQSKQSRSGTASKKRRVSDDSDSMAGHAGEESDVHMEPEVVPISTKVYIPKAPKRKRQDKALDAQPLVRYLEGVELELDPERVDSSLRSSRSKPLRWKLQVGDLIAVHCEESAEPLENPAGENKSVWFPFNVPWSPAQVIAVYHDGDDYQMEFRWFYRPDDVDDETIENTPQDIRDEIFKLPKKFSGRVVIEMDEHVSESPVNAALGRLVTTSNPKPPLAWLKTFKGEDGVPQLPLICRHFGQMNNVTAPLQSIDDWTDYGHSPASEGTVWRAICCPKSLLAKDPKLYKFYQKLVCKRFGLSGEVKANFPEAVAPSPERKVVLSWPSTLLESGVVLFPDDRDNVLHVVDEPTSPSCREFLKSVQVPVVAKRCDSRAIAKKTTASDILWTLQVGDFVCLANNKASKIVNRDSKRNPWYPYVGPWSFCQVLMIYRDPNGDESLQKPMLEVRYFQRLEDLPLHLKSWKPGPHESDGADREEVFETNIIESGIPASRVLGRVDLFLGHFDGLSNKTAASDHEAVPRAPCRCRYSYEESLQRLQPLFCAKTTSAQWFRRMLERGFRVSRLIGEHASLSESVEFCLDIGLSDGLGSGLGGIFEDFAQEDSRPEDTSLFIKDSEGGTKRHYYLDFSMVPPWKCFVAPDNICTKRDRKGLWYTLKVGDVVAVRTTAGESTDQESDWYPFSEPWRACQIVAIFQESGNTENLANEGHCSLQVRWFCRQRQLPSQSGSALAVPGLEQLYETNDLSSKSLDSSLVLGPISLFFNGGDKSSASVWKNVDPFLPVCPFVYAGSYINGAHHHPRLPSDPEKMHHPVITSGLQVSGHYSEKETESLLASLNIDDLTDEMEGVSETRTWMSVPPFHVDHATSTEYYSEIRVRPPYSEYAISPPEVSNAIWTVRLGDVVTIRYGTSSNGRAYYPHPLDKGNLNFPMQKSWAIGEVVTIMKSSEGASATNEVDDAETEDVSLEIRWFYRDAELTGAVRRNASSKNMAGEECEEVFESDHYQLLSPSSLLAPAALHPTKRSLRSAKVELGMPVLEFYCNQYYSVQGKSNLACGSLSGRVERGRLRSRYFGKDSALKKALDRMNSTDVAAPVVQAATRLPSTALPWKGAFNNVINKLSLTDASKEAYESRSALIGREEEKEQIMSFLEAAISGNPTDNKSSFFIAGPPGTGKTASVRAAISELQDAQSRGVLPNFDFISLNGMEMRHPFEAYVRMWEELNDDNARVSPEMAASKLEALFTDRLGDTGKGRVAVVLVDEIDYLVTKKQSVLYNLFDWPIRSLECGSKNRLVVIGVSNTLNLPERLHPRVQSRIGSRRCYFKSYSFQQTVAILKAKMNQASPDYSVFDEDAIIFASRKTAALSGDLRKAFHICRAAADMVMEEAEKDQTVQKRPLVRIKDVLKVSRESFNSAQSKAVTLCTSFEALLLVSLAALSKSTGREFGGFDIEELMTKMEAMANASGDPEYLPAPNLPETLGLLSRLGEAHIISLQTHRPSSSGSYRGASLAGTGGAWPLASLLLDDIAVLVAMRGTPHNELAQKNLMANGF